MLTVAVPDSCRRPVQGGQKMYTLGSWRKAGMFALGLCAGGLSAYAQRPAAPPKDQETFRFRFVGPRAGNRVHSAAGVPWCPSIDDRGAAVGGGEGGRAGGGSVGEGRKRARLGGCSIRRREYRLLWLDDGCS